MYAKRSPVPKKVTPQQPGCAANPEIITASLGDLPLPDRPKPKTEEKPITMDRARSGTRTTINHGKTSKMEIFINSAVPTGLGPGCPNGMSPDSWRRMRRWWWWETFLPAKWTPECAGEWPLSAEVGDASSTVWHFVEFCQKGLKVGQFCHLSYIFDRKGLIWQNFWDILPLVVQILVCFGCFMWQEATTVAVTIEQQSQMVELLQKDCDFRSKCMQTLNIPQFCQRGALQSFQPLFRFNILSILTI